MSQTRYQHADTQIAASADRRLRLRAPQAAERGQRNKMGLSCTALSDRLRQLAQAFRTLDRTRRPLAELAENRLEHREHHSCTFRADDEIPARLDAVSMY